MKMEKVVNFIFEIGHLKKQRHNGWKLAGIKDPDTVAEHVMCAAQIGYLLAVMEGDVNPEIVASMVLIHDNGEARIGDQNRVAARYFSKIDAEKNAFIDQIKDLEKIKEKWERYYNEFEQKGTKEGIVAKDADMLEQAFQGKEYLEIGYKTAQKWIYNIEKELNTKSAKIIINQMKKSSSRGWWKNLKKLN